jgi:hypothetical protein
MAASGQQDGFNWTAPRSWPNSIHKSNKSKSRRADGNELLQRLHIGIAVSAPREEMAPIAVLPNSDRRSVIVERSELLRHQNDYM